MRFKREYYFLSNFYPCEINYDGRVFKNAEAAFQSAKCINEADKDKFCDLNGKEAKRLGRKVNIIPDWDKERLLVMKRVIKAKFKSPELKSKLIQTGDIPLQEDNTWGDTFWGVCNGIGENNLGKILMSVRHELSYRKENNYATDRT